MIELDEYSMARKHLLKSVRAMIRLKHSLAADAEMNEVLPRVEAEFDQALAKGKAFYLDAKDYA